MKVILLFGDELVDRCWDNNPKVANCSMPIITHQAKRRCGFGVRVSWDGLDASTKVPILGHLNLTGNKLQLNRYM